MEKWEPQHDDAGKIIRFARTFFKRSPDWCWVTETFDGVRCEVCGELLFIGRFGMVCWHGHGKIIHHECESLHARMFPEMVIEHQDIRSQCKALRGCLTRGGSGEGGEFKVWKPEVK